MHDPSRPAETPFTPSRRSVARWLATGAVAATCPGGAALAGSNRRERADDARALLDAAARGDLAEVEALLARERGLVEATDELGRSAYALAWLGGHAEVGAALVRAGYDPDAHEAALALDWPRFEGLVEQDPEIVHAAHPIGGTPMLCAAAGGAGSDLWRVFAACAEPNAVPENCDVSPLQAALRFRDVGTAEMTAATLLANAADPNPSSDGAPSPLHIAASRGSIDLVRMLVRLGARIDAEDDAGRTPTELAESNGHDAVAASLRDHASIPRTHSTSRTAYDASGAAYDAPSLDGLSARARGSFVGTAHRDVEGVRTGLEADPRLAHAAATTSEIGVEAGAHMGRVDIVDVLLEGGAPYSLPTAVVRGDLQRARALLDEDPERIEERGAHDFALLWYPIIGGTDLELLELLLDRGAHPEAQDFLGTTALHWACLRGSLEAAERLVEAGADVHRSGRKFSAEGDTPLALARRRGHEKVEKFLHARGARR